MDPIAKHYKELQTKTDMYIIIPDSIGEPVGRPNVESRGINCGGGSFERPSLQRSDGGRFRVLNINTDSRGSGGGGGSFERPSMQHSDVGRFRVLNSKPCPLSAFEPHNNPAYDARRTTNQSRRSVFIRNKVRAEQAQARQRIQQMQQHLERISVNATNGVHTEAIEKEEEVVELVSSLQEKNIENEDTIQQLQKRLSDMEHLLQSHNKSMKEEVSRWEKKHRTMKKTNFELIEKMAAKVLEQTQSNSEEITSEVNDWKDRHEKMGQLYDELVTKVGELADENGHLIAKCKQLEEDEAKRDDELDTLEETKEENVMLHQSMEETMQLVREMNEKMASFVQVHESTVQGYEEKLTSLKEKLQSGENEEMLSMIPEEELPTTTSHAPREKNEALIVELKSQKQQIAELKAEKGEAYHLCGVFQHEIDMLRQALEDSNDESESVQYPTNDNDFTTLATIEEERRASESSENMSAELEESEEAQQADSSKESMNILQG